MSRIERKRSRLSRCSAFIMPGDSPVSFDRPPIRSTTSPSLSTSRIRSQASSTGDRGPAPDARITSVSVPVSGRVSGRACVAASMSLSVPNSMIDQYHRLL